MDRRQFLKSSSSTAAAATVLAGHQVAKAAASERGTARACDWYAVRERRDGDETRLCCVNAAGQRVCHVIDKMAAFGLSSFIHSIDDHIHCLSVSVCSAWPALAWTVAGGHSLVD